MSREIGNRQKYDESRWFNHWHRAQHDDDAGGIDLDFVGCCRECWTPIYLVEATEQKRRKNAHVAEELGRLANVPVFVIYRDPTRSGEFLVDRRELPGKPRWLKESELWDALMALRREHFWTCLGQRAGG